MADSCWRPGVGAIEKQSPRFDADTVDEESGRLKSADPKKRSLQVKLPHRHQRKTRNLAVVRGAECGTRYPDTPTKKVLRTEIFARVFLPRYIRAAGCPPESCCRKIPSLLLATSDLRSEPRRREGLAVVSYCSRLSHLHRLEEAQEKQDIIWFHHRHILLSVRELKWGTTKPTWYQ